MFNDQGAEVFRQFVVESSKVIKVKPTLKKLNARYFFSQGLVSQKEIACVYERQESTTIFIFLGKKTSNSQDIDEKETMDTGMVKRKRIGSLI